MLTFTLCKAPREQKSIATMTVGNEARKQSYVITSMRAKKVKAVASIYIHHTVTLNLIAFTDSLSSRGGSSDHWSRLQQHRLVIRLGKEDPFGRHDRIADGDISPWASPASFLC